MNQENLVPIDMKLNIEGIIIKDQFLWEASTIDSDAMRAFGLQILSERLGRTNFFLLSDDSKRNFSQAVTEIISYNINLYNKLNLNEIIGSINAKNQTGNLINNQIDASKLQKLWGLKPIVEVNIRLHKDDGELLEDFFYWDLTWNLNSPEEFSQQYWQEFSLGKIHEKQISFAIRKQIFDHLKQISLMKKYNLLKTLGIPVNDQMKQESNKKLAKINEMNTGGSSENSENEMYIPQ